MITEFLFEQIRNNLNICVDQVVFQFIKHYFFGRGQDMQLPPHLIPDTKQAVLSSINRAYNFPDWENINTAYIGSNKDGLGWYTTPAGVVGQFSFKWEGWDGKKHKFSCHDRWDFNGEKNHKIKLPLSNSNPNLKRAIRILAKKLGVSVQQEDNGDLYVFEDQLTVLNSHRAFDTRWEVLVEGEEIKADMDLKNGGLPEWYVKRSHIMDRLILEDVWWISYDIKQGWFQPWGEGPLLPISTLSIQEEIKNRPYKPKIVQDKNREESFLPYFLVDGERKVYLKDLKLKKKHK